ncbi:hypothetical protein GLOIN_2v1878300 [Rhizophagus clarus]|uniref:BTB domain-containing protein n=1 Tax=Rhizophagus clarus TaxID=94130 RepID=A0A8H3L9X3_9GLOM|nr:hypothetical protein GLOIN_2v1878300 [Rhizophagus clarus]
MASNLHSGLSKEFSFMLNNTDDFDVIIKVGENNNIKEFRAHSTVLCARSVYFKSALSNEWVTKKNDMILYNKPNIAPKIFDTILKYIYTGEVDLKDYRGEDILELLIASDELLLEELFEHVQDNLFKKRAIWTLENITLVLNSCNKLQESCLKFICMDPQPFITSKTFLSLDKDILYDLLKRDELQIDGIIVWECLIKWGIKQTPYLERISNDTTIWNNETFKALEKTLNKFIPLIKFVKISPADHNNKIRPYKAIIPHHIYEEIEEFFCKKALRKIQFESKIIEKKLISIIINWINKRDENAFLTKDDLKYKFDLIYQVKCQNSQKIFGGYTQVGSYHRTERSIYDDDDITPLTDSFIFCFERNDDTQNMKLSHLKTSNYAVYINDPYCGFKFGEDSLYMQDSVLFVGQDLHYEQKLNYKIDEIESTFGNFTSRSVYFKSALSSEWVTKKDDMILLNKPNITPKIFDIILEYIYTGKFDLKYYQAEDILELIVASDELLLEEHVQDNITET